MSSYHGTHRRHQTRDAARLRLRPLQLDDKDAFFAAHWELAAEGFHFGFDVLEGMSWRAYLRSLEECRAGLDLAEDKVPATFLVADVEGTIVGRSSIRHELNEFLAQTGGHIGYAVRPRHRRRGYATEILRQSLIVARAAGVDRVLVTCDDDNEGSRKAIEACGGQLESILPPQPGTPATRRYWFD